eukprot:gene24917-30103_t
MVTRSLLLCAIYIVYIALLCAQDPVPSSEVAALYDLYESTHGPNWIWPQNFSGIRWNFTGYDVNGPSSINPCAEGWQGVLCDCSLNANTCNIVSLNLTIHNITGSMPDTISNLTYLEAMYLPRNHLSGSLPSSLSNLTYLELLNLGNNLLSGTLADWFGHLTSLVDLDLSRNRMTGNLTESVFTLRNLNTLALQGNSFRGTIPSNVSCLTLLSELDLSDNLLSGTLPSFPPSLIALRLQYNFFEGPFPPDVVNLTQLVELDLGENLFYGPIPSSLPSGLNALYLAHNMFVDSFPPSICSLTALNFLDLTNNLFSGPIPTCIGDQLTELRGLQLGANLFSDSVPTNLNGLTKVNTLFLWQNVLSGRVNESLLGFPALTALDFSANLFFGPLPEYNWTVMTNLAGFLNQFTGTLPTIYTCSPLLYSVNFIYNLLSGTIPNVYSNMTLLNYFSVSHNLFTGPLFSSYSGCPNLVELTVGNNRITGTLSPMLGELQMLYELSVNNNRLRGTIPPELGNLSRITTIDLSHNSFTGSIPAELAAAPLLEQLYVNNNKLVGNLTSLVNPSVQEYLLLIDVSQNLLTGPIPTSVFYLKRISSFAAASNCLTGSLPVEICEARDLSTLVLDGAATAHACRRKIFPGLDIRSFVLQRPLTGTIPACVFALPYIRNLHLSANFLSGSLPEVFSMELVNLTLSRNLLTGSIPRTLQEQHLSNLDLSYNRLHGGLVTNISDVPQRGSLYLQVNRLSGDVPSKLDDTKNIDILNGNLFTCPYGHSSLPKNDPNQDIYACGSSNIEVPVIIWASLLGLFLVTLLLLLVNNTCDKLGQWTRTRQDSFSRRTTSICRTTLEKTPENQEHVEVQTEVVERPSGLLGLDRVVSFWSHLKELDLYMRSPPDVVLKHILTERQIQKLSRHSNIPGIYEFFDNARAISLVAAVVIFVVFMPVYASAPDEALLYQSQYGWKVSAVLMGGHAAVKRLSCVFALALAYLVGVSYRAHCRYSPKTMQTGNSSVVSPAITSTNTRNYASLFVAASINTVVMIAVDVAYVLIVLNYAQGVVLITEIFTAAFKLFWNDFALWSAILQIRSILGLATSEDTAIAPSKNSSIGTASSLLSPAKFGDPKYEKGDVPFMALMSLFNNIIVPAIAIACVSSTCFEDALIQPAAVDDEYFSIQCLVHHSEFCTTDSVVQRSVSYDPPFIYSYMCASTIYMTYLPVLVYSFIFVGFVLPSCRLLLRQLMHRLQLDASSPAITHNRQGSSRYAEWKEWLRRTVPLLYQPAHPSPVLSSSSKFLSKEKLTVRCVSQLAVLLVFGVIYPPLAVIGCVSIFLASYTEQYLIGSMVQEADWAGWLWYREKLSQDADGLLELFAMTCWLLVPFACLSFAFLLFDTLGYTDGWRSATLVSVMVAIVWPVCIYLAILFFHPMLRFKAAMSGDKATDGSAGIAVNHVGSVEEPAEASATPNISVPLKVIVSNSTSDTADEESPGPSSIVSVDNPLYTSFGHGSLYSMSRQDASIIADTRVSGYGDDADAVSRTSRATFGRVGGGVGGAGLRSSQLEDDGKSSSSINAQGVPQHAPKRMLAIQHSLAVFLCGVRINRYFSN